MKRAFSFLLPWAEGGVVRRFYSNHHHDMIQQSLAEFIADRVSKGRPLEISDALEAMGGGERCFDLMDPVTKDNLCVAGDDDGDYIKAFRKHGIMIEPNMEDHE